MLSVASLLNGCKKDDGNESKGPNVEGVFWFGEEDPAIGIMEGLYLKDGYMSYCAYAKSDEGASMLSVGTSKTVKKGNIVLTFPLGAYTIVKNEDGTSGTINSPLGKIEYSGLTDGMENRSVHAVIRDMAHSFRRETDPAAGTGPPKRTYPSKIPVL